MQSVGILRIESDDFPGSHAACEGRQIAKVVLLIRERMPQLRWYVADVQTIGRQFPVGRDPVPLSIGDAVQLAEAARGVQQFESGVFVGVPADVEAPRFREGGLWTEDEEQVDLGDGVVEIRALDTTCVEVLSINEDLLAFVAKAMRIASEKE